MHYALAMDEHLHLLRAHAEQVYRLNDLKTLIHHSGRVDSDFCSHTPIRVFKSLVSRCKSNFINAHITECSTACRQNKSVKRLGKIKIQSLPNCAMFAIDRVNIYTILFCNLTITF